MCAPCSYVFFENQKWKSCNKFHIYALTSEGHSAVLKETGYLNISYAWFLSLRIILTLQVSPEYKPKSIYTLASTDLPRLSPSVTPEQKSSNFYINHNHRLVKTDCCTPLPELLIR